MEPKKLTFEQKKEFYNISLGVAGVTFNDSNLTEILIKVYERVIETGGAVPVKELVEIRNDYLKKYPVKNQPPRNEPPRKAANTKKD